MDSDFDLSAYHQPYASTVSFVWSLPFGHGRRWGSTWSPLLDGIAGGWQISGVNTMTPGETVTFVYSPGTSFQVSAITNDFAGANNYRPDVVCDPYATKRTITPWFNPACVTLPTDASQPFGNAERNSVRGPTFRQFDLAAMKRVSFGTVRAFEVRVEAFNVFSRVNYGPPASNRSNSTFGTITMPYDSRHVPLGFKFLW